MLHAVDKVSLNKKEKEMWGKISIELYRQENQYNYTY
jgi:hypothetical protein